MNNFPRYDSYKDSGVDWLGKIPEHWEMMPGFTVVSERKEKNTGMAEKTVLSLSYGNVVIKPEEKLTGLVPESFETYQKVYPGDIIIRPTDLQNDHTSLRTGLAKDKGIITSAYINLQVNPKNSNSYIHYFLHTVDLTKVLYGLGSGLRQNLSYVDFKRFVFVLPPLSEQADIAKFLDRKTAQVEQAIAQKERLIELLKERRQILIHKAVTRGLNPNVKLKHSGVDWIGEVPEHWNLKRVKEVFRLIIDPAPNNNNFELLSLYTDIGVKPRRELEERGNKASTTDGYWFVKKGDFVVNKLLAWMGAIGVSNYEGVTSPAYDILRPILKIKQTYFHELFRTKLCSSELKKHSRGIMDVRLRLYFDKFGVIKIPFPPFEEQVMISEYIENFSAKIETAISCKQKEIEKLKEYKAVLINSAVTGKIKVEG